MNRFVPQIADRPKTRLVWETARAPDRRLWLFAGLTTVPLLVVLIRLGDLQAKADGLIGRTSATVRTVTEAIPARDGRILSSDGHVLAEDIERFDVLVQYRWLERPANAVWLRGEALDLLTRSERRDPDRIAEAENAVLARREQLWQSLMEATGLRREELFGRFATIQERVSAIHRAVQKAREESVRTQPQNDEHIPAETWWQWAWQSAAVAVTTPPKPSQTAPLILAEELEYHEVADGLPIAVAATIEANPERFPGTSVRVASRRRYPLGATASHLIGYRFARRETTDEDTIATTTGQTGVERSYDRHLRGIDGLRRVWLDRRGEPVRSTIVRAPRVGRDLVLHLDLGLQTSIERLLDEAIASVKSTPAEVAVPESAGGAIVVLDVRTGAVLAAASAPRFDLGRAAARSPTLWNTVQADPGKPLFDRVCTAAVPPGSVFKPVTAIAFLESGKIDPDAPFHCIGYLNRKDRHRDYIFTHFGVGHGPTTLASALAESCNVYFFQGARTVGATPLLAWADRLGYGRPTGIDLPSEAAGHIARTARQTDALGVAIGQAELTATPLQVARMTAAIATGGRLVTPHVVRGSGPTQHGSESIRPILHTAQIEELQPDTLSRVREGLEQAVSHPRGTGFKTVQHAEVAIAGKTGTAEVGNDRPDHAWFAGYAPADDPQIAFVVLLEHGGSGGQIAGPVAHDVVTALLRRGLLRP